jgi:hypothetical protein
VVSRSTTTTHDMANVYLDPRETPRSTPEAAAGTGLDSLSAAVGARGGDGASTGPAGRTAGM